MKRISVFISVPQFQRLKQMSATTGLPLAELLRRAIDRFLERP
jgi:predicted DNA-binding protein